MRLRARGIPLALHADLGNDAAPTRYLPLMEELLCLPLGMRSLDRPGAEHMLGLRHQLLLPVLDLIRVHLELLGPDRPGYALLERRPTRPWP